ncbi:MAG: sigma-70 family RNA polymerase sigma factor [Phycisphaerales bacterium]|nr:MAG: sigma-70 family RNA polymerase sigma factor [Phycisphaerales bacterium]
MASTTMPTGWLMSAHAATEGQADLERAFALHGISIYRYFAVRTGGDTHLADDLMQTLWMRAKRSSGDMQAIELEGWLRAIAKNLIREHWRKQATAKRHMPAANPTVARELAEKIAVEDLPEEYLHRQEVRDQLILSITELSTIEQEVTVGYYFQGESQMSLAKRLGTSERAVEGRLYRARRALRERLQNLEV